MASTVAEIRTRFPELASATEYPDLRVQMFLDDVVLLYMGKNEARWGGKYDIAQAYLAAHLLVVATFAEAGDVNAGSGKVASKSAGNVSVSYDTGASTAATRSEQDAAFSSTYYGQQFILIRNRCFAGVLTAYGLYG